MPRFFFFNFLSLALLIACVSRAIAGPACSRRHWQQNNCVEICKSKWGWSSKVMGTDAWGAVMQNSDSKEALDAVLSKACGSTSTQSEAPTQPAGNAQTGTPSVSSSSYVGPATDPAPDSPAETTSATPVATTTSSLASSTTTSSTSSTTSTSTTQPEPTSTSVKPTTTPANDPIPTPSPGASAGSTPESDIQAYLSGHNSVRAQHGAAALTWSDDLAGKAQQWANGCKFQHSGGSLGPFGENLAAGTGPGYSIQTAIKSWTDEVSEYDSSNPQPSHFTQVVWKGTQQVGCAVQSCEGIFDASFGKAKYYVCEYSPAGNIIGQFPQNVQA